MGKLTGAIVAKARAAAKRASDLAVKKASPLAVPRARKTVPINATGERVPYVKSGHLSGVTAGSNATRAAYSNDPRASWTAGDGRDIIYDALGVDQLPTRPATGFYTPPGGVLETNPATVALPVGALRGGDIAPASRRALDLAESLRAYTDVQGAGAYHVGLPDVKSGDMGSLTTPTTGPTRASTLETLQALGTQYGLPDVVDTGRGVTLSNFYPGPPSGDEMKAALSGGLNADINALLGAEPRRVKVASGYLPMFEEAGAEGSGVATGRLADLLGKYPESVVQRLDADPALRARYASGADLDAEMAQRGFGAPRDDVQTARRILSAGGLDALMAAFRGGKIPLPVAAAGLLGMSAMQEEDEGRAY